MKISVTAFGASTPKIAEHLISNNAAIEALNCDLRRGLLEAMKTISNAENLSNASTVTAYNLDTEYIAWDTDVDIVSSFVYDTNGRIYYTGDGVPKQTDLSLAISGGDPSLYPKDYLKLGLPKPSTPLNIALNGTPGDDIYHTTSYTYTYVTAWGEESEPADATAVYDIYDGHEVWLSNFATTDTTNLDIDYFRIYRIANGSTTSEYQFVADVAYQAGQSFNDTVDDSALGEVLPTEGWCAPPENLAGLMQFSNGILIGFFGNQVALSEPFMPYAWPEEYRQQINHNVVGIGAYGQTTIILTTEVPYLVSGIDPESVIISPMPYNQGCVSKKSIVSSPVGVFFASPDGLCVATDTEVVNMTEALLTKDQWQEYDIENLIGFYHEGRYTGFFSGSDTGFIIDKSGLSEFTLSGVNAVYGGYIDTLTDTIKLIIDNSSDVRQIADFNSSTSLETYTWKSKHFVLDDDTSFSCGRALGDYTTGTATLKIYADDTLIQSKTLANNNTFRIPARRGKTWHFEIIGQATIKMLSIASTISEL